MLLVCLYYKETKRTNDIDRGKACTTRCKNQARKAAKKRKLDTTIEARSHTDVSGYLSSISILMLGPHYGGELSKWKSLCDPYNVPVVVIPQDIYAQLNGDALIQLALDTLGK